MKEVNLGKATGRMIRPKKATGEARVVQVNFDGEKLIGKLDEYDALLRKLRDDLANEKWQHAACLSIACGDLGWDKELDNDSAAMIAVRKLRRKYDELARQCSAEKTKVFHSYDTAE